MEAIDDDLILLLQVIGLKLQLTMVVEPDDLSISKILHVKHGEITLDFLHLARDLAFQSVLKWPVTASKNLCLELDFIDNL